MRFAPCIQPGRPHALPGASNVTHLGAGSLSKCNKRVGIVQKQH